MHFRRDERLVTAFLSLTGAAECCLLPFLCLHLLQLGVPPLPAGLCVSLLLLLRSAAGSVWWRWLCRRRSSGTRRRAAALGLLVSAGALAALAALPPWPPCQLMPAAPASEHQSWQHQGRQLQGAGSDLAGGTGYVREDCGTKCRQRPPDGTSSDEPDDYGGPATSQQVSELGTDVDRHEPSASQSVILEAHHTIANETHRPSGTISANHAHHTTTNETHRPADTISANHAHHTTANETHRPAGTISANHAHHTAANETHRPAGTVSANHAHHTTANETHRPAGTSSANQAHHKTANETHRLAGTVSTNHAHHTTANETHRPAGTVNSSQLINSVNGPVSNSGQPAVTDDSGLHSSPDPWAVHDSDEQKDEGSGDWMARPQYGTAELSSQSGLQHQSVPDDVQSNQRPCTPQHNTSCSPPQTSNSPVSSPPDASLLPSNVYPSPSGTHGRPAAELAGGHHWGDLWGAEETSSGPSWTAPPEPQPWTAAPGQSAAAAPPESSAAPSDGAAAPVSSHHHPHHHRQHDEAAAASHRLRPATFGQNGDMVAVAGVGEGSTSPVKHRPAPVDTGADRSEFHPGGDASRQVPGRTVPGGGQPSPLPADSGVSAVGARPWPGQVAAADPPTVPSDRGEHHTPQPHPCVELSQLEIPFDPLKYPDGVVICDPVTAGDSGRDRADSASGGHQVNFLRPAGFAEHGSGHQSSVGQAGLPSSGGGAMLTAGRRDESERSPAPVVPSPAMPFQHVFRPQYAQPLTPPAKHKYARRRKQSHRHREPPQNAELGEWHDAAKTETEINTIATIQHKLGRSRTGHVSRKFGGQAAGSSNTRKDGARPHHGRGRYLAATTKQPGDWGIIRRLKQLSPTLSRLLVRRRAEPVVRRGSRRRALAGTDRTGRHRRGGRQKRSLSGPKRRGVAGYITWLPALSSALKPGEPEAADPVVATEPRDRDSLKSGSTLHASPQHGRHLVMKPSQQRTSALAASSISPPNTVNLPAQRWEELGPADEPPPLVVSAEGESGGRSSPSRDVPHPSLSGVSVSASGRLNSSDVIRDPADVSSEVAQAETSSVGVRATWRWPGPSASASARPPRNLDRVDWLGAPHPEQRRVQAGGPAVHRLSPAPSRQQAYLPFLLAASLLVLYGCLGAPYRHVVLQSWRLALDDAEHLERQGRHLWAAELTGVCVLAASAAVLAVLPECVAGRRSLAGLLAVAAALCVPALCLLPWLPLVGGKAPPARLKPAVSALISSRSRLLFVAAVFSVGAMTSAEFNFLLPFSAARRSPATFVFPLAVAVALVSRLAVRAVHCRMVSSLGSVATVVLSLSALTARCLCYLCLPTQWGLLPAQLLSGLTETLFWRGLLVFVEENARSGDVLERTTLRLLEAVYTAGRCAGATLAGLCFTLLGGTATFAVLATASAGGALGYYVLARLSGDTSDLTYSQLPSDDVSSPLTWSEQAVERPSGEVDWLERAMKKEGLM